MFYDLTENVKIIDEKEEILSLTINSFLLRKKEILIDI